MEFLAGKSEEMLRIQALILSAMIAFIAGAFAPDIAVAQDQIYGSQMMTPEERNEYQTRMRNAGSDEEREQIRAEHHERMRERAEKMGVEMPDELPARGMGQGMGQGMGRGQGGGMGMGRGQGSQGGGGGGR